MKILTVIFGVFPERTAVEQQSKDFSTRVVFIERDLFYSEKLMS